MISKAERTARYVENLRKKGQYFQFAAWRFDVDQAQRLIEQAPREIKQENVAEWAAAYKTASLLPDAAPSYSVLVVGPRAENFNREYALSTDLTEPVIIAQIEGDDGKPQMLLIDGCHRLYRHFVEGSETMPAVYLTVVETALIKF